MSEPKPFASFEPALGYNFQRPELLAQALTHKSFANEQSAGANATATGQDNERLEFLGDAVLDLALSEILMRLFPGDPEGGLSKKRASLVNEEVLSQVAAEIGLDKVLRLGRGEIKTGGLQKPRILASSLEAVFGAIFLDSGYTAASMTIVSLLQARLEETGRSDVDFRTDFKTRLQEKAQEVHRATPTYKVESESGPDHDKQFEVSVRIQENVWATGTGRSKKAAEQDAARQALEKLNG